MRAAGGRNSDGPLTHRLHGPAGGLCVILAQSRFTGKQQPVGRLFLFKLQVTSSK